MSEGREPQHEGFLQSDDIGYSNEGGKSYTLTIESVAKAGTVKDARGAVVDNEVVYFKGAEKGLVINRTNTRVLALLHGKDREKWKGKQVKLTVKFVNAFGETDVPTIRIEPPNTIPLPFAVRKWQGRDKPKGK
jgi:hypothetical protein